jgi:preprotein translocase subunit SecG
MLYTSLIVVHVLACVFLIAVVLLQTGKGADMGAVFGGSSETVFGSSGAGNFLTKLTTGVAALFMLTSLVMTYGSALRTTQSLFDDVPEDTSTQEGETTEAPPVTDTEESSASDPQASAPPLTESSPTAAATPDSETQTLGTGEPQAEAPSAATPSS